MRAVTESRNGWTIHAGQLFLNWDAEVSAEWRAFKAGYLKESEPNWSRVLSQQLNAGEANVYRHNN
ncbi:MAG: hypothetical protein AB8B57_15620 [Congregibacter sp.]